MNKKGQSLAIFIVILPLIFAAFLYLYDYSVLIYEQNKYENISKSIILSTQDESKIKDLYEKNSYEVNNFKYKNNNEEIYISNYYYIDTILSNVLKINKYKCEINYIVSIENNDIIIRDNKGE